MPRFLALLIIETKGEVVSTKKIELKGALFIIWYVIVLQIFLLLHLYVYSCNQNKCSIYSRFGLIPAILSLYTNCLQ